MVFSTDQQTKAAELVMQPALKDVVVVGGLVILRREIIGKNGTSTERVWATIPSSGGGFYVTHVDRGMNRGWCSCPQHEAPCYHKLALALAIQYLDS